MPHCLSSRTAILIFFKVCRVGGGGLHHSGFNFVARDHSSSSPRALALETLEPRFLLGQHGERFAYVSALVGAGKTRLVSSFKLVETI